MRDKYSFSLRQLDSTSLDGRTLKFSEMGHLPRRPADEDEGAGRERGVRKGNGRTAEKGVVALSLF